MMMMDDEMMLPMLSVMTLVVVVRLEPGAQEFESVVELEVVVVDAESRLASQK